MYKNQLQIELIVGGITRWRHRTAAFQQTFRNTPALANVQCRTGQSFKFENALPEDFIYDTEPACRALVSVATIDSEYVFPLLHAI
ncbi:MAG: hypothetical protein IPJ05_13860 [Nitrosomonas sp.]|nr:hypothetical protein [Nitrosomonas sp.]